VAIKKETDIAVIGGGVIGLLTACLLAKNGCSVTIIEQSQVASESSWAGGGILSPLYPWRYSAAVNHLASRSQQLYPGLVDGLRSSTGVDPQFVQCGMLINKFDVDDLGYEWLNNNQIDYFNADEMANKNVPFEVEEFLFLPKIAQIRNPRFAQSLKKWAEQLGVEIFSHWQIDRVAHQSSQFNLESEKGKVISRQLIVCAGAWSAGLLKQLGIDLPIKPVRGQMLLYKATPEFLSSMILSEGHYIIPRLDGHVLVGSTMEDVGFDKQTTSQARELLESFIERTLPELQKYPVEKHWAGLRPGSPDGVPFISSHPSIENLYVNTGHFRNGVVMAPASAELLVDLVLGKKAKIDASPYSLQCG